MCLFSMASLTPRCFHRNALDGLIKIARTEGPAQLWRGTDLSLAVCVPAMAVYFPLYDYALQHLQLSGVPTLHNVHHEDIVHAVVAVIQQPGCLHA